MERERERERKGKKSYFNRIYGKWQNVEHIVLLYFRLQLSCMLLIFKSSLLLLLLQYVKHWVVAASLTDTHQFASSRQ